MFKKAFILFCATFLSVAVFRPNAIVYAAYNFPSVIGQFTGGDCTTTGPNSYNLNCSKFNGGTAFGNMAAQTSSAVSISGGAINSTPIGGSTPSSGSFTTGNYTGLVTMNGGQALTMRVLSSGASTTLASSDAFVCINKTSGSATAVAGAASPVIGQPLTIKDCKGDASTNNITFTPASGNVDGASSLVLNQPYQAVNLVYNGTSYSAF